MTTSNSPQAIFLDTSIQIDRFLREPEMKAALTAGLSHYSIRATSSVVLQEFKRRIYVEAQYLLDKLNDTGSYQKTIAHVNNVLPPQQERKRHICLNLLFQALPGASDPALTERAKRYLRSFILYSENEFRDSVDSVLQGAGCYWATYPIGEQRPYEKYFWGHSKCSKSGGRCQISGFLKANIERCRALRDFLNSFEPSRLTIELKKAKDFLEFILEGSNVDFASSKEPCLTIGDLLILFESDGFKTFYTKNYRESVVFCDFSGQNIRYRPNHPARPDIVFDATAKPWPETPTTNNV